MERELRRKHFRTWAVVCAAFINGAMIGVATACRCTDLGPRQAYRAADGVVYGTIIASRTDNDEGHISYVFQVDESWKRRLKGQITIETGTTCAYEASVGRRYVIFLKESTPSIYETAACMGNRAEAVSQAVLGYLHRLQRSR